MYTKLTETQVLSTNFATEQKEWLGKHCPDFIDIGLLAIKQLRPEPPSVPRVGSHVEEVKRAETETETAERNGASD